MLRNDPVVVSYQAITAYGEGTSTCWEGLLQNRTAIRDIRRFDASHFHSKRAAIINDINVRGDESLVMQMLAKLSSCVANEMPVDTDMILASLNGEVDFVESEVLFGKTVAKESRLDFLLDKAMKLFGIRGKGIIVSAACTSSSVAIARAASMVRSGQSECVLVVACECVSEFIIAGFSSLMALDKDGAKPFDKDREGITIGEAAAYVLVMSRKRAEREKRKLYGNILGWGISCDANHMTRPSVDGEGLVLAIERALNSANVSKEQIANIAAHGTGTVHNDSMEMKAFKRVFGERQLPTYSIKGGIGHTMGAAGIMDTIVALKTLEEKVIPPTVGLINVEDSAVGWVKKEKINFEGNIALSTNSGFGGTNSVLVLDAGIS